jgi:hypothetical protein
VVSLCGESSGALGRDLVTGKQYSCVNASTTWTRGGLVPTDTKGKIACQEFVYSHPSLRFRITLLQSLLAFTFLEWYHARIGYRLQNLFWDEGFTLDQP